MIWKWFFLPLLHPPQRWWWREDRTPFERFMDFFCERLYPILTGICVLGLLYSMTHYHHCAP